MIDMKKYFWPLLAAVALMQSGAVAKIVWDRDSLIKSGREIILPVVPVDPRDIFRGDYVVLGYQISPIKGALFDAEDLKSVRRTGTVYQLLRPSPDGTWTAVKASTEYPKVTDPADVVLKGQITATWGSPPLPDTNIALRFGIESYFVPEGTGRDLEALVRDKKISAIVAVGSGGDAALKGLVIDGERKVDPPLL